MDVLKKYFPGTGKAFSFSHLKLQDLKDNSIYIFDTNILLELYVSLFKENINNVKDVLFKLKTSNRLYLPARVAREFAKNRGRKIAEIYKRIKEVQSQLNSSNGMLEFYPLLERNPDYIEARGIQRQINQYRDKYRQLLERISDYIKDWDWQDPVSKMYADIFTDDIIIEMKKKEDEVIEELKLRQKFELAPGYKDGKKPDEGIGDLIVWQTIIEIGKEKNNNIIFVTNDNTKGDWFHVEYKNGVFPKAELFEEFNRETNGKLIKIIDFNKFLELFKLELQTSKVEYVDKIESGESSELFETEMDKSTEKVELCKGMLIQHDSFGKGEILSVNIRPEDETKVVSIRFEDNKEMQFLLHLLGKIKILEK